MSSLLRRLKLMAAFLRLESLTLSATRRSTFIWGRYMQLLRSKFLN